MGCGPSGHIGKYLFDKGLNVTGIDMSEKCIDIAKNYNRDMTFKRMDMMNLQVDDQSIDGIIAFYSIIHTPFLECRTPYSDEIAISRIYAIAENV